MAEIYRSALTEFRGPPYLAWFVRRNGWTRRQLVVEDQLPHTLRWPFDGDERVFQLIPVMGEGQTPVYLEQESTP